MMRKDWRSGGFLDRRFQEFLQVANYSEWEFVTNQYDVTISKQVRADSSVTCMKGAGQIRARPHEVFDVIWDIRRRHQWDKFVDTATEIRQYDPSSKLAHILLTKPLNSRMVSPRDLCVLCAYQALPDGSYVVILFSVEDDDIPPREDLVRAKIETSGFIIEPDGEQSSWVTYIIQMNYKGWLPEIISNRYYQPLRISTLRYVISDSQREAEASTPGPMNVAEQISRSIMISPRTLPRPHKIALETEEPSEKPISAPPPQWREPVVSSGALVDSDDESQFHDADESLHSLDEAFSLAQSSDSPSSHSSQSVSQNMMQTCLQLLQHEIHQVRSANQRTSLALQQASSTLQREMESRQRIEADRQKYETEESVRIHQLLTTYMQRVQQVQDEQTRIDTALQDHAKDTDQRITRLEQSLQLCVRSVRDAGRYHVYWGCVVFFLWCLWPLLLMRRRVYLIGLRPFLARLRRWSSPVLRPLHTLLQPYLVRFWTRSRPLLPQGGSRSA